ALLVVGVELERGRVDADRVAPARPAEQLQAERQPGGRVLRRQLDGPLEVLERLVAALPGHQQEPELAVGGRVPGAPLGRALERLDLVDLLEHAARLAVAALDRALERAAGVPPVAAAAL